MIKKLKPYLLISCIVFGMFVFLFLIKGIYPFGSNSLIWGDMHDQITAFYYHFYDAFHTNKSLLISFTESGGVNFIGILAYYILSPFSFLVLFVKRENIYLVVSIIIALKILLSGLTCLYFIRSYFKKLPNLLGILLAIVYAFSGYSIIMYQITPWIDAMYMFPLILIGLKKTLDLEKPTFYIIPLTFSLIFSFYVSIMIIIFIFLSSWIYLLVYQEKKKDRKKAILTLGITTSISVLLSLFVLFPAYSQISVSSRVGFSMKVLLNSKTGPITDKASIFLFGGVMYTGLLLLLKNYKKHTKFLSFYIPTLLIVLIPVIIEPIHKVWHFGSYAFFPYRFGFVTMLLLVVGACYAYENYVPLKGPLLKRNQLFSMVLTAMISVSTFIIMYVNYTDFQKAVNKLTISANHWLLIVLVLSTLASIIGCFVILLLNRKLTTFSLILIMILTISHILSNSSIYLGMDYEQKILTGQYKELNMIARTYHDGEYFRVKNEANNMIMNSGMVMKYHTWDHFTSLTDRNNLQALKKLGYSSMWVKTYSKGGNLFLDAILANKYIITRNKMNNDYYHLKYTIDGLYFYELKNGPSYGYIVQENGNVFDAENSFAISNSIYRNITGKTQNIFETIDHFELENMQLRKENDTLLFEVVDGKMSSYIEKEIFIHGKKTVYLELLKSIHNQENYEMYGQFHIYLNGKLFQQNAFTEENNGVINFGTFEEEKIKIRVEFMKSLYLNNVTIGIMDNEKYEEFIKNYQLDTTVNYDRNQLKLSVTGQKGKMLLIPLAYNPGYTATNNGKKVEVIKLYDNFIGISLQNGINNIELTFIPPNFVFSLVVSCVTLVITIFLWKSNLLAKITESNLLENIAYYLYMILYFSVVLIIYVGLTICFIISYFRVL